MKLRKAVVTLLFIGYLFVSIMALLPEGHNHATSCFGCDTSTLTASFSLLECPAHLWDSMGVAEFSFALFIALIPLLFVILYGREFSYSPFQTFSLYQTRAPPTS